MIFSNSWWQEFHPMKSLILHLDTIIYQLCNIRRIVRDQRTRPSGLRSSSKVSYSPRSKLFEWNCSSSSSKRWYAGEWRFKISNQWWTPFAGPVQLLMIPVNESLCMSHIVNCSKWIYCPNQKFKQYFECDKKTKSKVFADRVCDGAPDCPGHQGLIQNAIVRVHA